MIDDSSRTSDIDSKRRRGLNRPTSCPVLESALEEDAGSYIEHDSELETSRSVDKDFDEQDTVSIPSETSNKDQHEKSDERSEQDPKRFRLGD